jgi:hypothetical protein
MKPRLLCFESSEAEARPSGRELVEVVSAEDDAGIDLELLEALVHLPGRLKRAKPRKKPALNCFVDAGN